MWHTAGGVLFPQHLYSQLHIKYWRVQLNRVLVLANKNQYLLKLVATLVEGLGFKQNTYVNKIQVSRKTEVQELKNLLQFRDY